VQNVEHVGAVEDGPVASLIETIRQFREDGPSDIPDVERGQRRVAQLKQFRRRLKPFAVRFHVAGMDEGQQEAARTRSAHACVFGHFRQGHAGLVPAEGLEHVERLEDRIDDLAVLTCARRSLALGRALEGGTGVHLSLFVHGVVTPLKRAPVVYPGWSGT
jgi:hypothetical protein